MAEKTVELLGQLAVQQKLVTADQLKLCLAEQTTLRKTGKLLPLGQILVQRRFLSPTQMRSLLLNQKGVPSNAPHINGKYALVRKLGRGGAGDVYLARDTALDRPVAIKILREEMAQNRKSVERFLREARVLAKLRHPNVVGVHETGEYEARPYFVMDYVDGTSLDVAMAPGAMALRKKVEILAQVSGAVGELHRHGVVHRDLKPSNVLIDASGNPILLDFGLAHDVSRHTRLTATGTILGTPFYMAPEQVEGKSVDARTDVYALGVILYEMITGHLPFRVENEFELYRQISTHEPPTPSTIERRVPRDLEIICIKAMDKDPNERYTNASEFADDLRRFLKGHSIKARPVPFALKLWRRVKRHRIAAAAIAGSLFVGLIAASALIVTAVQKSKRVDKILKDVDAAFQEGDLRTAEKGCHTAKGIDPDHAGVRDRLGLILRRQEEVRIRLAEAGSKSPEEAEKIYGAILQLDRENPAALSGLRSAGLAKAEKKRRREQSDFLESVRDRIAKFEKEISMPWMDFLAREPAKSLQEALPKVESRLEEMDEDYRAEALYLLGRICGHLGRTAEAQNRLDQAVALASRNGRYYYERGSLALSHYRREYARVTEDARRQGRKDALEQLQALRERAQKDFQEALKLGVGDGWETDFARAVLDYTEGRTQKAFDTCLALQDRGESAVLKLLGQISLDRADYRSAIKHYARAADLYRSDPEAHLGLADAYLQQAQYDEKMALDPDSLDPVIREYDVSIRLQPTVPSLVARGQAKQMKSERLLMRGRDAFPTVLESRADMTSAIRLDHSDPHAHHWLGITYVQGATVYLFRTEGFDIEAAETEIGNALYALEQAIGLDPRVAGIYHNRAVARGLRALIVMMRGDDCGRDLEGSLADLKKSIELGNQSYGLYEAKALTHLWKCVYLLSENQSDRAMPELVEAISACDVAVQTPVASERARTIVFRATLRTIRGLHAFMLGDREICLGSMRGATEDLSEAVRLHPGYSFASPDCFDSIRRAMELQFDRKDPKPEYRSAREGLTQILAGESPRDSNAHVLRLSALLMRGFANYYLEQSKEAVSDWEELIKQVPPFKVLLQIWLDDARKKAQG